MTQRQKLFLQCIVLVLLPALWLLSSATRDGNENKQPHSVAHNEQFINGGQISIDHKARAILEVYDQKNAYEGITVIPAMGTAEVLAVDMRGTAKKVWHLDTERVRLLENGHLLAILGSKWGLNRAPWSELRNTVWEYNTQDELVWEYEASDVLHHDIQRLKNGNTLILKRTFVPEAVQKAKVIEPFRLKKPIRADSILEITPEKSIVHSWHAHEHLDLNYCGLRPCAELESRESDQYLDWTHINTANVLPENQWYENGDTRFKPGNLIIVARNWWQIIIIDKDTGEPVWRYRGTYRGGMSGGHEAEMIPPGLPGAGNILVLDNGTVTHKGESIILEIEPPTSSVVWKYENGKDFFTKSRGACQRLPNGNTLISEDRSGRVFEVTVEGKIVWSLKLNYPINRAKRYPLHYCKGCS